MVGVIAVDEILHDRTTLEQADGASVGKGVRQGGNASVGVDVEEPWLLKERGVED